MTKRHQQDDRAKNSNPAETGRRLLDVLFLFTSSSPRWSIHEISRATGFSVSTTYRYISALKDSGLVSRNSDSTYFVTDFALVLAEAARAARPPIAEIASPILDRIRDEAGESVFIARRAGWNVIMVARSESESPVQLRFEPGRPMLLHSGSLSRVLLATMPKNEQRRYLASLDPETQERSLLSESALEQVSATGITESFEEVDEGIWGVAAAIEIEEGEKIAVGCAAPLYRNGEKERAKIRSLVEIGARELSDALSTSTRHSRRITEDQTRP